MYSSFIKNLKTRTRRQASSFYEERKHEYKNTFFNTQSMDEAGGDNDEDDFDFE